MLQDVAVVTTEDE